MTVPWIENREIKLQEKEDKYANIIRTLRCENVGYDVEQATFVIDCLGGYSKSLNDNLKKISMKKKRRTMLF